MTIEQLIEERKQRIQKRAENHNVNVERAQDLHQVAQLIQQNKARKRTKRTYG